MKKTAVVLAIAVLLITLTACGGSGGDSDNPTVTLKMSDGKVVVIELFPDKAPKTVTNFLFLADSGLLTDAALDRFEEGLIGGSAAAPFKTPGEMSKNNTPSNDLKNTRGAIGMWHDEGDYDSAQGEFYVALSDLPQYDGEYCVFGRVKSGLEALDGYAAEHKAVTITEVTTEKHGKDYSDVSIVY